MIQNHNPTTMKYSIIGNSLPEQLANAGTIKKLFAEFVEPYQFLKGVLLNEQIVSHKGKLYLKDKGTLTAYDFMQTEQFKTALSLTNRKAIREEKNILIVSTTSIQRP